MAATEHQSEWHPEIAGPELGKDNSYFSLQNLKLGITYNLQVIYASQTEIVEIENAI